MSADTSEIMGELEELLKEEHAQIMAGQIDRLGRRLPEKDRLMAAISASDVEPEVLSRLQRIASRNQKLLEATARGIRTVMNRINALKANGSEMRSYTQTGKPKSLSRKTSSLERKA